MYRRFERKRTPTDTITSAAAAKKSKQQNSEASGNIPSRQAACNQVTSETQVTWDTTTETIYPRCAQGKHCTKPLLRFYDAHRNCSGIKSYCTKRSTLSIHDNFANQTLTINQGQLTIQLGNKLNTMKL